MARRIQDLEPRSAAPAGEAPPALQPGDPAVARRAAVRLLVVTLFAAGACAVVFAAVLYADFLTRPAEAVMGFFYGHTALAMLAACSPLFGALLIGYGYMQRAMRRRRAAAKQAAATH
jgi:hypothetical protein